MSFFDKLAGRGESKQIMPSPDDLINNNMGGQGQPFMDPFMMPGMPMQPNFSNHSEAMANATLAQVTLDMDSIIESFRSKLRGYYIKKKYNPVTKKSEDEKIRFGSRFCNDEGINELVGDLHMYVSKALILSNIPDKERKMINAFCKVICMDISIKIASNTKKWEVNKTLRSSVTDTMAALIWGTYMRSLNAGERTGLYGTMKTVNTNVTQGFQQPVKKSMFEL